MPDSIRHPEGLERTGFRLSPERRLSLNQAIYGQTLIRKMIQKTVTKISLKESSNGIRDLTYWLSRTPEERVAAVDYLRRQLHGSSNRLQRSARVIQRTQG